MCGSFLRNLRVRVSGKRRRKERRGGEGRIWNSTCHSGRIIAESSIDRITEQPSCGTCFEGQMTDQYLTPPPPRGSERHRRRHAVEVSSLRRAISHRPCKRAAGSTVTLCASNSIERPTIVSYCECLGELFVPTSDDPAV